MENNKEQKLLTCYHCGNKGLLQIEGVYETKRGGPICDIAGNILDYDPVESIKWELISCPVCQEATLHKEIANEEYGYTDTAINCYPNIAVQNDAFIPEHIKNAFNAALKVKNIDVPICFIALRRVLEAICKDKGAAGNDLSAMIKDLVVKKILPEMLDDACWVIRQLGNSAAHADRADFYNYEAERTTEFVGAIIDYLYVLPNKIGEFKQTIADKLNAQSQC